MIFALKVHRVSCSPKESTSAFVRSLFVPLHDEHMAASPIVSESSPRKGERSLQRRSNSGPLSGLAIKARNPSVCTFKLTYPQYWSQHDGQTSVPTPRARSVLGGVLTADPTQFDESSAGEDLYPRSTLVQRDQSPDRRKSSIRRPVAQRSQRPSSAGNLLSNASGSGLKTPPLSRTFSLGDKSADKPTDTRKFTSAIRPVTPKSTLHVTSASLTSRPAPSPAYSLPPTSSATAVPHEIHRSNSSSVPRITSQPRTPPMFPRRFSSEVQAIPDQPRELPQVLILERLERCRPSVQQSLLDILRERRVSLAMQRTPQKVEQSATAPSPIKSSTSKEVHALSKGFFIVAILVDKDDEEEHDGAWGGISRHLVRFYSLASLSLSDGP